MTLPVRPSRAGVKVSGPVLGEPDHGRVVAPARRLSESGSGGALEPRDSEQGEVVAGVVVDRGRVELGAALDAHRRVVLARDHVGVGDHQPGRRHPARALDPEPAGGAEHAHGRGAGCPHLAGRRRVGGRAGGTSASGPRTGGVGSTRRSTFSSGPEGGRTSLRTPRIADFCTASRRSRMRSPVACRATAPNPQQTSSARAASSSAPPRPSRARSGGAGGRAGAACRVSPSRATARNAPDQHPGDRRDQRRVLATRRRRGAAPGRSGRRGPPRRRSPASGSALAIRPRS